MDGEAEVLRHLAVGAGVDAEKAAKRALWAAAKTIKGSYGAFENDTQKEVYDSIIYDLSYRLSRKNAAMNNGH